MSKVLAVQFSDGNIFYKRLKVYSNISDYNRCKKDIDSGGDGLKGYEAGGWIYNITTFIDVTSKTDIAYIKPEDSNFIYPKSAIVKFGEIELDDIKNWERDFKLGQLIN